MKDDLGFGGLNKFGESPAISDVCDRFAGQLLGNPGFGIQARISRGRQCVAVDFGAELGEPKCQPGAFEAGMPGDEHTAAGKRIIESIHDQIFHGALPLAQSSLMAMYSRYVSIAKKKPSCR